MSKHGSSGNKADDRSEELLSSDAFAPEKSGMGKEIKISLAAITVLLGVLGYVLYGHFFGSAQSKADTAVAATEGEDGKSVGNPAEHTPPAVSYSSDLPSASGTTTAAGSSSGLETDASPVQSRWDNPTGPDRTSASQVGVSDTSPSPSYMPSATPRMVQSPTSTPQTATDRYSGYSGGATAGTSTSNWPPATATDSAANGGQTSDPFQRRTIQETGGSAYPSQPYGGGYQSPRPTDTQTARQYEPSTSSRQYSSNWGNDSQPSTAGTATVVSDADTPASSGLDSSGSMQNRTYQQGTSSDYSTSGARTGMQSTTQYPSDTRDYTGTSGSSVRVQPTSQYSAEGSQHSTDNRAYTASNSYRYSSGTGSTQTESRTSTQDYATGTQSSTPRATPGFAAATKSSDISRNGFPDDDVSDGKYTVQPNDTLYDISEKFYGSPNYFKALVEHNRATVPDGNDVGVGKEIAVPDVSELERAYPHLCPTPENRDAMKHRKLAAAASPPAGATVYVVQEGDTLFDIARYELGKASRWAEIYKLNRERLGKSFDYLTPGLKLEMPSDQPVGTMTQRPGVSRRY